MKFFDYIFYRVSRYYMQRWGDDLGYFNGMALVSLLLNMHLAQLRVVLALAWAPANYYLFERWGARNFSHPTILIPGTLLLAFILLRYLKLKRFEKLDQVWGTEDARLQRKRAWLIAIYVVANIVATIAASIWRARCS